MDCQQIRTALSARLDGEDPGMPEDVLDTHLDACPACQQWYSTVAALGRNLTMGAAVDPVEDAPRSGQEVAEQVLRSTAVPTGSFRRRQYPLLIARIVLVILAIGYFVRTGVLLFGGSAGDVSADGGQASFVFDAATHRFALGIGLVWVAARPKAATAVLPIYLALWAFGAGFATRNLVFDLDADTHVGNPVVGLLFNLVSVIALLVCWLGRHHMFTPLSQSWRTATAQPVSFSTADILRNSSYRMGDKNSSEWDNDEF